MTMINEPEMREMVGIADGSPIRHVLGQMDNRAEMLGKLVDELGVKLQPILTDSEKMASLTEATALATTGVPLGNDMAAVLAKLEEHVDRLASLSRRIAKL